MQIDWPVILAFSKVVLTFAGTASWPAAAGIIAFKFREPISDAIGRARKLSVFGVGADLSDNPQLAGPGTDVAPTPLSVPTNPQFDAVLSPKDKWLRDLIEKEPLSPVEKYDWAIRIATQMMTNAQCERIYRLVYGTQLTFLRQLNGLGSVLVEAAREFFANRRAHDIAGTHYNFEEWLQFLVNEQLVQVEGAGNTAIVKITPDGRNFLTWMVTQGVSEEKPL